MVDQTGGRTFAYAAWKYMKQFMICIKYVMNTPFRFAQNIRNKRFYCDLC